MTDRVTPDPFSAKAKRLALLSDRILGAPGEIDAREAEELLRASDIDPQEVKVRFHRGFDSLAKKYAAKGQRVPPLLKQALTDLRPGVSYSRIERELLREAQTAVRHLFDQAKRLPALLLKTPDFTLAAAYRNKKDLSDNDKKLLDEIARNLENRTKKKKGGARPKGRA